MAGLCLDFGEKRVGMQFPGQTLQIENVGPDKGPPLAAQAAFKLSFVYQLALIDEQR